MPSKPKPYQRPAIDLGAPSKVWKTIPAAEVRMGDIVQGRNRGWVTEVNAGNILVTMFFKNGTIESVVRDDILTVFTEESSGISK